MTLSYILDGEITQELVLLRVRESMSNEEPLQTFQEELEKLIPDVNLRPAVLALIGRYTDERACSIAGWVYAALKELEETEGKGDGDADPHR